MISFVTTYFIKCYAQKNLLDIPNQRSSHQMAKPKGGGLAIVVSFFFAVLVGFFDHRIERIHLYLLLLTLFVAAIGFWDDHQPIPAYWRLMIHFSVAVGVMSLLNGFPMLVVGKTAYELGIFGYIIGVVFLVWLLNLFNFMDGIDGLAASETVFVAGSLACFLYTADFQLFFISVALAFSCSGFLIWNWPLAKIFMGDVGSGFLGLVLAMLILMASHQSPVFLYVGMILTAVFFVDATYTLLVRMTSGQKWYDAHCSHAYQQAAKQYGHLRVVQIIWSINLFWLLPVALFVYLYPEFNALALIIAYLPLLFLSIKFNAGKQQTF
jgi:Fuc2NAc and GlcNAc transferase